MATISPRPRPQRKSTSPSSNGHSNGQSSFRKERLKLDRAINPHKYRPVSDAALRHHREVNDLLVPEITVPEGVWAVCIMQDGVERVLERAVDAETAARRVNGQNKYVRPGETFAYAREVAVVFVVDGRTIRPNRKGGAK